MPGEALAGISGCGHCFYIIMAPIVGVRVYEEMEVNRANIDKLEKFTILNECADPYTNVDADLVESELDLAYD